jgi:hypothetical protein
MSNDNILATIIELQAKKKAYLQSPLKTPFLTTLGTLHSFVGNYTDAIRCYDEMEPSPNMWPKVSFGEVYPVNAVEAIRKIADTNSVVFINEAHHIPQHRAFSILVLKELYRKGFRYFAAETLKGSDKELNSRGYPVISKSGFYTNEPIYGDLIRTALRLGYQVIPYESEAKCQARKEDITYCQNSRERIQAENLHTRIFNL